MQKHLPVFRIRKDILIIDKQSRVKTDRFLKYLN